MKTIKKFDDFVNESLLGTIQLIAIGYFIWKLFMSIIERKFRKDNEKLYNKLQKIQIINVFEYIKNLKTIPVIDLEDRYFIRLSDEIGNSADIRIMKEEKKMNIDTYKGNMEINLTDDEYSQFISLLNKK